MALWQSRFRGLSSFSPYFYFFVNASKSVKRNATMSTFCDNEQYSYEISSLFWPHNLLSPMSQSQRSSVTQSSEFLLAAPEHYWCFWATNPLFGTQNLETIDLLRTPQVVFYYTSWFICRDVLRTCFTFGQKSHCNKFTKCHHKNVCTVEAGTENEMKMR